MLKILLCDDDLNIRKQIETLINNQILICEYDMKIAVSCDSPVILLEELKRIDQKKNIYFLDVDLKHPGIDGFQLGKKIREIDPNGIIIYITSFKDLAYKTFQLHIEAFDYIVKDKDHMADSIANCLKSIEKRMIIEKTDPTEYYTFRTQDTIRHILLDDMYFFETSAKPHFIILHGKQQRIEFLGNLSDIEKELSEHFIRIHRSYLVALNKIEKVDLKRNEVIVNGQNLSLSRKEKSNLLKKMNP